MENVITFTRYWYLIKRTTNSAGIRANWINCVLYKVLLNLHIFPVLNIYCAEPYLDSVQRSYVYSWYWQSHGPLIPIKVIVQFLECKISERVLLNGAISICRKFSKVSHRFETKMCGLSLLACEQALLFGRVKRVSRERASEQRSREGPRKGVLATISHKISFVLRPDEGKYHWRKNDVQEIKVDW